MKKLLNFLLVRRSETENKWWHRLFTVILFGSGILVSVFAIFFTVDSYNHTWVTYRSVAFSLEANYQQANGKEFPCNWSFDTTRAANEPIKSIIECKGVEIPLNDARQYGTLYEVAEGKLRQTDGIKELDDKFTQECKDQISTQTFSDTYSGTLTPAFIAQIKCVDSKEKVDVEYNQLYKRYQNDLNNLARVKVVRDVNYGTMFGDVLLWLIIPILSLVIWILFWSSIIYRSVLYIIFGKKK
jgi:hypothetical protein